MNRFENKVVVITGAASGIGEATTRRIVSEGGKVVIADHSEKKAEQLANELTHAGADVRHVYFSATELQSCKELIDFSMNEYQRIDILINNVGGTDPKRDLNIEKLDINYFDEAFHLNLCCTMYLSQQVIPIMTANGGGNIVNVASISGLTADANGTLYGASKAGVINLTKYIATQMGKKNIRCNAVAPGLVLTPAALNNLNEDVRNIFLGQCATPYLGEPEDVAATIAFLASNDARYITGQTIVVDGGLPVSGSNSFTCIISAFLAPATRAAALRSTSILPGTTQTKWPHLSPLSTKVLNTWRISSPSSAATCPAARSFSSTAYGIKSYAIRARSSNRAAFVFDILAINQQN